MFVYYINVPLNEKGIEEFETYDEEMVNVKIFELTKIKSSRYCYSLLIYYFVLVFYLLSFLVFLDLSI